MRSHRDRESLDGMGRFPEILPLGLDGLLVRFDDRVSDRGNAAAVAFAEDISAAGLVGLREIAPALTSVAVFFDPLAVAFSQVQAQCDTVLAKRDWSKVAPSGGTLWRVPVSFEGPHAPQLADVAGLVGCAEQEAVADLTAAPLRVLALGFAPGQPYLGILPDRWDIPRQVGLSASVPEGAVVVAVRQAIVFATTAPTGWRQVGWTGFRPFARDGGATLRLRAGDQIQFSARPADEVTDLAKEPLGGAEAVS